MQPLRHVLRLVGKELMSLRCDPVMLVFLVYGFTAMIYVMANGVSLELRNASVAIVDEDHSILSRRFADALAPPYFRNPVELPADEIDRAMDRALYTFVIDVPPDFEADVVAGRTPTVQLNVDATAMSQAGIGAVYIRAILLEEAAEFTSGSPETPDSAVRLVTRAQFNPNLVGSWFMGINGLTMVVAMLSVILTGAAIIREREHGTLEHLLVMPLRPFEIMLGKIVANSLVVLAATALSTAVVIRGMLGAPLHGSPLLFLTGAALNVFAMTCLGVTLATLVRSMPQFGLLMMLVVIPVNILSGGNTPFDAMPDVIRWIMFFSPTTHFVTISQAILFRGAGLAAVWLPFVAVALIAAVLFGVALARFRASVATTT
ncbi:MAG: ABC transporter permease [Myxococcota bacterium]